MGIWWSAHQVVTFGLNNVVVSDTLRWTLVNNEFLRVHLLRSTAIGVCGSDFSSYRGWDPSSLSRRKVCPLTTQNSFTWWRVSSLCLVLCHLVRKSAHSRACRGVFCSHFLSPKSRPFVSSSLYSAKSVAWVIFHVIKAYGIGKFVEISCFIRYGL